MAEGAILRRLELPGTQAHHAHSRSAHRLRERALPEHGRVLGAPHGDVHDSREHLHARVRILRRAQRQAAGPAGRGRAGARGRSRRAHGVALRRRHFGEPRRSARRRRGDFRPHDRRNSRSRAGLQGRSADPGFSRRLERARNRDGGAARRAQSQYGNGPAALSPRAQRRGLRAFARIAAPRARTWRRKCRRKPA